MMQATAIEITRKQAEAYVHSGGNRCPACGSDDIEGGDMEIDSAGAGQVVNCHACGADWVDCYVLVNIIANDTTTTILD